MMTFRGALFFLMTGKCINVAAGDRPVCLLLFLKSAYGAFQNNKHRKASLNLLNSGLRLLIKAITLDIQINISVLFGKRC